MGLLILLAVFNRKLGLICLIMKNSTEITAESRSVLDDFFLMIGNAFFFVLPVVFWLFMTVLMKHTEEKWLRELYDQEYEDYCKRDYPYHVSDGKTNPLCSIWSRGDSFLFVS